jgi:ABC-2 type transport system permease protein
MTARATAATAGRVLQQLRRDRRTLALVVVVAPALLTLFRYIYDRHPTVFDRVGAPMIGIFPLVIMFLLTSIAMLRERSSGTLERLMSLPVSRLDILVGYAIAFAILAALEGGITGAIGFGLLGVTAGGPPTAVVGLAILNALLGMALGLLLSAFASTEFQAVQFMPAVLLPQILLSGLLVPRSQLPAVLHGIAEVLPVTYSYDALARVAAGTPGVPWTDLTVVIAAIALALCLGAATLRRRTS